MLRSASGLAGFLQEHPGMDTESFRQRKHGFEAGTDAPCFEATQQPGADAGRRGDIGQGNPEILANSACDTADARHEVGTRDRASLAVHMPQLFPFLSDVKINRQWAGMADMTADFATIMGMTPVRGLPIRAPVAAGADRLKRLPTVEGEFIERACPVEFTFEGRHAQGYRGDTMCWQGR